MISLFLISKAWIWMLMMRSPPGDLIKMIPLRTYFFFFFLTINKKIYCKNLTIIYDKNLNIHTIHIEIFQRTCSIWSRVATLQNIRQQRQRWKEVKNSDFVWSWMSLEFLRVSKTLEINLKTSEEEERIKNKNLFSPKNTRRQDYGGTESWKIS